MVSEHAVPTIASVAGDPSGWRWTLASGLVLIAAGVLALAAPTATTVYLAIFLGWILLVAGAAAIVMGLRARVPHRRVLDIGYGVVSLALGMVLLAAPVAGALTLTLGFALWLVVRGVVELAGAARSGAGRLRFGLIVAGGVNLVLAALLLANFPFPAVRVIGLFVGISFLAGGALTLAAAVQLRRLAA